jgi:hypothetical protein
VKITVERGGGLAGLVRTVSVDSASLSDEQARTLQERVDAVRLFELPGTLDAAGAQPDSFTYAVTLDDGMRRHRVLTSEAALTDELRDLIAWLESAPTRQERFAPPGG